ncbi:hypothetical protein JCM8547_003529 [Rhodosporidiobolus lusitaniae]
MPFSAPLFALCLLLTQVVHTAPVPAGIEPVVLCSGISVAPSFPAATSTVSSTSPSTSRNVSSSTTSLSSSTPSLSATFIPASAATTTTRRTTSTSRPPISSSPSSSSAPSPIPTFWSLSLTSPTSFQCSIRKFVWGQSNVALVPFIPSSAWGSPSAFSFAAKKKKVGKGREEKVFPRVDLTNSTALRVVFPKGSMNPGNHSAPVGGAGLYMNPLNLTNATTVSFSYSVFFPSDFDFVKGGKLPGLYGGKGGCSGGSDGEDCWSTRTMFRKDGAGELYLYAPRSLQSSSLCSTPPLTYCNSKYGMSIGRGSWTFKRGGWTTVKQRVRMNTPGKADGGVEIWVDGVLVLKNDEVAFRTDPSAKKPTSPPPSNSKSVTKSTSLPTSTRASSTRSPASARPTPTPPPAPAPADGLLGSLLNGLGLGNLLLVDTPSESTNLTSSTLSSSPFNSSSSSTSDIPLFTPPPSPGHLPPIFPIPSPLPPSSPPSPSRIFLLSLLPTAAPSLPSADTSSKKPKEKTTTKQKAPVGIDGIMLDTFFGGSDGSWASPKRQAVYFGRVEMRVEG